MDELKTSYVAGGRVAVYCPSHPKANNRGYILRSRYMMEQYLGRLLQENEEVHHKNNNKLDDRLENFELLLASDHARYHMKNRFRSLDYDLIKSLLDNGLGCRRIAKFTGYNLSSVKYAMKSIRDK